MKTKYMKMDTVVIEAGDLVKVLSEVQSFVAICEGVWIQNIVIVEDTCQGQWFAYIYHGGKI